MEHPTTAFHPQGVNVTILRGQSSVTSSMNAGETRSVTIRDQNTGTSTWSAGEMFRLGAQGDNQLDWSGWDAKYQLLAFLAINDLSLK